MKPVVFLYAPHVSRHVFSPGFGGESAAVRSLRWADSAGAGTPVFVATYPGQEAAVQEAARISGAKVRCVPEETWDTASFLSAIYDACDAAGADTALVASLASPFLDAALTRLLCESHERYFAEYTAADGYPLGLSPEVIGKGTVAILRGIIQGKPCEHSEAGSGCLMAAMRTDINSFEIESVLSPEDWRLLRLDFTASSKRTFLSCKALYDMAVSLGSDFGAESLSRIAAASPAVQCTVPAYCTMQIASDSRTTVTYNAFAAGYKRRTGEYPVQNLHEGGIFMEEELFSSAMRDLKELSEDAVVCLGGGGEPLLHPRFADFVRTVLSHGTLRLLIETDGTLVTESLAKDIADMDGSGRVTWIVSLDATTPGTYGSIHVPLSPADCGPLFSAALGSVPVLEKLFPKRVFPQMVRMRANEDELEQFYRFWHDSSSPSGGNVIIQKYDSCCGFLSDEKPADLSPLERIPCWHVKRDITVLADGSVPLCPELVTEIPTLSIKETPLAQVWEAIAKEAQAQVSGDYPERCRKCDEYYTFNF